MTERRRGPWREPLLHMIVLGALVFAADRWWSGAPEDARRIHVTAAVRQHVASELHGRLGRAPSDDELARGVQGWIDRELLYREGLALGLAEDDPIVRDRVVQKMESIEVGALDPTPPTDADLEAFVAAHPDRYGGERRYDFVQLVRPKVEDPQGVAAHADLAALENGADPRDLGPRVGTSRRYTAATVARTFGPAFAEAITGAPVGRWILVELPEAWSVVRVDVAATTEPPALDAVRERVRADVVADRRRQAVDAAVARLRADYEIVEDPP